MTLTQKRLREFGRVYHHDGIATADLDSAIRFFKRIDYRIGKKFYDRHNNINVIFCTHEVEPWFEIVSPGDAEGLFTNLLEGFDLPVRYNCYFCCNLMQAIGKMQEAKLDVVCVSQPQPTALFEGSKAGFYRLPDIGLIEIVETTLAATD